MKKFLYILLLFVCGCATSQPIPDASCLLPWTQVVGLPNSPLLRNDNCGRQAGSIGYLNGQNYNSQNNSLWFDGNDIWANGHKIGGGGSNYSFNNGLREGSSVVGIGGAFVRDTKIKTNGYLFAIADDTTYQTSDLGFVIGAVPGFGLPPKSILIRARDFISISTGFLSIDAATLVIAQNPCSGCVLTSDNGGNATWQQPSDTSLYYEYAALISEDSATGIITAQKISNTLPQGTPVWTRIAPGGYQADLVGAFPLNKTLFLTGNGYHAVSSNVRFCLGGRNGDDNVSLLVYNGAFVDGITEQSVLIRVYK